MTMAASIQFLSRLVIIMILAGWGSGAQFALADVATPVDPAGVTTEVDNQFPQGMQLSASIPVNSDSPVREAALYYQIAGDETLNLVVVPPENIANDGSPVDVSVFIDFQMNYVPAGVTLTWFWEATTTDGDTFRTDDETGQWSDPRFDWTSHKSSQVTIYTYDASDDFAQWMLDESQATIDDLEQRYDLEEIEPVAIWVYPDYEAFMTTMQANTRDSVAGMSYPGASVILAIVADGDEREFGRVILHEISHQVLFHATGNPYGYPPLWFDEGLATRYQTGGTDHYPAMVWRAAQDGTLFDISSLNMSFPFQPAQATLAYASSWSILGYIESTYGPEGISRLIAAFGDGLPVDDAIEQALEIAVEDLNSNWHQWVLEQGNPGN